MNTQLRFTKPVTMPGSIDAVEFSATLSTEGVTVVVGSFERKMVEWEKIEDVEFLADHFWDAQVWEFREIIKLLAQARQAQGLAQEIV